LARLPTLADPRRGRTKIAKPYPRIARVNETLRHAIASEIERVVDENNGASIITVTGVECDPDLRKARVYLASLDEETAALLEEERIRVQGAIGRKVRLKRTPQLQFQLDPAILNGEAVENALRSITISGDD